MVNREKAEFEEIGRQKLNDTTQLVISTVRANGEITGMNINTYITSQSYTGYAKGVFIPNHAIAGFINLINQLVGR